MKLGDDSFELHQERVDKRENEAILILKSELLASSVRTCG